MHRRALLTSLAVGATSLAGCASSAGDEAPTTNRGTSRTTASTTTDTDAESSDDERRRPEGWTSIVELETGPRTYAFRPTTTNTDDGAEVALWFDRTATADHPARLRGWFENGNDFENTFRIEWIPAVGRIHSRTPTGYHHEARLHFAPTENNALAETVPEVTRNDDGYWRVTDVGPWMSETIRMDPGERVDLEYVLVGEPGMPGRPTGTYEFRGDDDTASVSVWDTNNPGPAEESRFAGRSVPEFDGDRTVQWYHDADRATSAFVRPSTERIELDGFVGFEAVNHSHEILQCGHWNLYKLVDGRWFHVAPRGHTSDCRGLAPGGTKEWSLRAFNGEAVPCNHDGHGHGGLTQGFLGGGEYAVVAGYGHPADASAAMIELVGESVELVPTDDATSQRDGDTVTVTTDKYGDGEHPPDAAFTLTRTDSATERVLAEQVMAYGGFGSGNRGFRNALAAMAPDVDRVVLRTDEYDFDYALREEGASRRFRFRGQAYEIARGEVDE